MSKRHNIFWLFFIVIACIFSTVTSLTITNVFKARSQEYLPNTVVIPITGQPNPMEKSLQLHTFPFVTITPTPTSPLLPTKPLPATKKGSSPTPATKGGYTPPNASTCSKNYQFTSPLKKNFGDPRCDFSKDKLYKQLKQLDPKNAMTWYIKVIPCESGFNPNAYASPQTGTPDAHGAWGLFQMGSSTPAGKNPPAPGKNGRYDRGDVSWETQIINATTYGKQLSRLGAYWACAR